MASKTKGKNNVVAVGVLFVFATFCMALCYNLFLLPNNLVIGLVSGLGIIVQHVTGFSSTLFIYILNVFLLVVSYFLLGKQETKYSIVGSLLFPLMITFTEPIARFLLPYFNFDEFLVIVLLSGILYGFSSGLAYKCGFSLGGSDVVVRIFAKYFHIPEGKGNFIVSLIVIIAGGVIFGIPKIVYATIIIYISSIFIDKVMFGISNTKTFYVFTKKEEDVKKVILKEFESGFTIIPTEGGYSKKSGTLIMCVLPNREYYRFKKRIIEIDDKAFLMITDCYESHGGFKKKNLPFI